MISPPKCTCGTIITSNYLFNKHEVELGHTVHDDIYYEIIHKGA